MRARSLLDDTEGRVTLARFMAEGLPDTSIGDVMPCWLQSAHLLPPFPYWELGV